MTNQEAAKKLVYMFGSTTSWDEEGAEAVALACAALMNELNSVCLKDGTLWPDSVRGLEKGSPEADTPPQYR